MRSDAELLAQDAQSREEALDTRHSFIVQAPAGSGKTELLIQRYLKLLGESQSPEEVLAITFTRKAASEMQQRVVAALREALTGEEPAEAHRKLTLDLAGKVLAKDREKQWQLIESPRRMRIQTLDALNAAIARSLPLSSGLGGGSQTVADEEMRALYMAAATATLDWLTTEDRMRGVVERILGHLDNNTGLYVSYIARMLASRDQWLLFVGGGIQDDATDSASQASVRAHREQAIARMVELHLARASSAFPGDAAQEFAGLVSYAAGYFRKEDVPEHPLYHLDGCSGLPGSTSSQLGGWQAVAEMLLTKQGGWRKTVTKREGFPPGDAGEKAAMCQLLEGLAGESDLRDCLQRIRLLPQPRYSDEQWEVLVALVSLLPYAVAELQTQFSRAGVTDHIEVARAAGAALGSLDEPGEITLLLDYRIRHLLIDEMQDTSIGQYHLLELLIGGWEAGDGRTIFCVGDPMQSIYRFRDADVSRFLLARKEGIGTLQPRSLLLRRNFRSGENLVHWFNTVFAQVMPVEDDPLSGAISYAESVPVPAHEGGGEYHVYPLFDATPEDEASTCAEVVRESLAAHKDRQTTVLVRSRTQLPQLLSELRRLGIEYQAIEIDRLTDLPEIVDITALTRAICHDGDRLAWLALLRGPWLGMTWQDLHALVVNDTRGTVQDLMRDHARLETLSVEGRKLVTRLLDALGPFLLPAADSSLQERVERAWFALGGPLLLQDAEQLRNVYRFLDVVGQLEFAGTLPDVAELSAQLDQVRVSSRAGIDCRLQIMTMHKAKGLQFDNVVLFGLGRMASGNKRSVLSWLNLPDDAGHTEMIISPVGPRFEVENDPLHRFIETTELEKDRAELDRLLYVACTRAIHSLHLVGHVAVSADGESFRPPRAGTLLHRLWPALASAYEQAFASRQVPDVAPGDPEAHLRVPVLKRIACETKLPAAPPLPGPEAAAEPPIRDEHAVSYYWVGSASRHAGTIVHQYLKMLAGQEGEFADVDLQDCRMDVQAKARQLGVSDKDSQRVCERVEKSLQGILSDSKGRWILQGDGHAELALTGRWRSRTESIVIDRVRIDADGVHWIIDYKTSAHEGSDLKGFLSREIDRYQPQLERYAGIYAEMVDAPIRAALYFPLLQEFCEVEIAG